MLFSSHLRLKAGLITALAVAALAGPALAQQRATPTAAPQFDAQVYRAMSVETPPPGAVRIVMPCDTGAVARRNYERLFGQTPVFVTAEEAIDARDRGEVWATPRCMTQREHVRLSELLR